MTGRLRPALGRGRRIVAFASFYCLRFLRDNFAVARAIVAPRQQLAPAVVEVPLRSRTAGEVAGFIALVTLTPGSMALELSADRSRLTVHGMFAGDPDLFRAELQAFEDLMLAAWRSDRAASFPGGD